MTNGIDADTIIRDIEYVDKILREKDTIREELIEVSREIIRLSSRVIHSVHDKRLDNAKANLIRLRELVEKLLSKADPHPDLMYSGLIYNALSEYVEAYLLYSLIAEKRIPSLSEINVLIVPYLQGLGDLVGELRRHVIRLLDDLRVNEAEIYLQVMDLIYRVLKEIDYPEPLIPGVRHKVDVALRLVEDTRVLLLSTKNSLRCLGREIK
ncbi:MAG: haloacid dehalogenase [Desulfurococcaceae archaeon]